MHHPKINILAVMKKQFTVLLFAALFVSTAIQAQVLNVTEMEQEQTQWCWAGTSACILDYYCTTTPQCNIAEYTRTVATWHNFGTTNCCVNPSLGCNYWNYNWGYPGSIQDILIHFASIQNYGYGSYLSTSSITNEIQANRPFVIRWGWTSGGGHFLTGHGLIGTDMYYMDPWYGEGLHIADYSWVVSGVDHTWTHTNILTTSSPRPYPAGNITGPQSACIGEPGLVYSVGSVTNATGYVWEVSPAAAGNIVGSGNTATLNLSATFTGTLQVTVKGQSGCGFGAASAPFSVLVNPLEACQTKALNISLLPEGLYNPSTGHLFKAQDQSGNKYPGAVADKVTIQIASGTAPYAILYTLPEVSLDTLGSCSVSLPGNLYSPCYIIVKHRNSIETWSASPVSFPGSSTSYDFTAASNSAYSNNLKAVSGRYCIYSGDVNQDGIIDSSDMIPLDNSAAAFVTGYLPEDINGDGLIDSGDMIVVDNNATAFISSIRP